MTSSVGSADDYHASLTGRTRLSRHRVPAAGTAAGVTCLTARPKPVASRYPARPAAPRLPAPLVNLG